MIVARSLARVLVFAVVLVLLIQATALSQEAVEVEGSADFRNPPLLSPGTYTDSIVTGESVWYSVLYTNDIPYRFEVSLEGIDLDAQDELSLEARFVGPTLGVLRTGRVVEGPGASYNGGTSNVWYLEVALDTTGRLGVEHKLILSIDGVMSSRLELCSDLPDCDSDQALADLDEQVAELETQIAEAESGDAQAAIEGEMENLQSRIESAETRAQAAEAAQQSAEDEATDAQSAIAEICSPEADCSTPPEPAASTPAAATGLGILVLLGGLGFLGLTVRRRS